MGSDFLLKHYFTLWHFPLKINWTLLFLQIVYLLPNDLPVIHLRWKTCKCVVLQVVFLNAVLVLLQFLSREHQCCAPSRKSHSGYIRITIETYVCCLPELALNPLGQIVSHLNGEVLAIQGLHLVQRFTLQLLGLNPHCHGAPVEAGGWQEKKPGAEWARVRRICYCFTEKYPKGDEIQKSRRE